MMSYADKNRSPFMGLLAIILVIACAAIIIGLMFIQAPVNNKDILNIAIGIFLGYGGNVISYYFGSSQSSDDKTNILAARLNQNQGGNG